MSLLTSLPKTLLSRRKRIASVAGLTLIECLVAIIMIGLSTAAVTPALVIAAATRVQTQKAEQAIQLAQGEVERVRLLLERGRYVENDLPAVGEDTDESLESLLQVGPPNALTDEAASSSFSDDALTARPVSVGATAGSDFIIQTWRSPGISQSLAGETVPVFFNLGVRVYDRRAFDNNPNNLITDNPSSLGMTGGEGQRSRRPLAVIYTPLAKGDMTSSLCDYFRNLGDNLPDGEDNRTPPASCP